MFPRFVLQSIALLLMVALVACQPPTNNRNRRTIGRNAMGATNWVGGQPQSTQPWSTNTQWGAVSGMHGDQNFQEELWYFTSPMLGQAGPDEQLGYVSAQPAQTGVFFWGQARIMGSASNGQLDGSRAVLHLEIWDNRAGQVGPNGSTIPQVVVHIGPDQAGFVSAQGYAQNGRVFLTFTHQLNTVVMDGAVQGQTFTGNIGYSNQQTGGQTRFLGRFQVNTCGFFACN